jgi:thioredoxin reductase (NADPH)
VIYNTNTLVCCPKGVPSYLKTNEDMQTSINGVYAVGDVISKKYRQITTAVADGTIAAIAIAKELD